MSCRMLVLSDLHLEFAPFATPSVESFDVAILAGDIDLGLKALHWAQDASMFGGKPVILVPGNHEFYGSERIGMLESLRSKAAGSNVHLLDRDEIAMDGVRFLGTTLWTDFRLDEARGVTVEDAMQAAARGLNDFTRISQRVPNSSRPRRFSPTGAAREHRSSRAWLLERLKTPGYGLEGVSTVVVTHHAPSARSMDARYAGNDLNPCFYSELPKEFFQDAALWIHGHTHSSADYQHHRTRCVG